MFFRNVNDESFDEIQSRNTFGDCLIVFMSSVMKGYSITVIIIDAGSGDDRTTKITTNIFDCDIDITIILKIIQNGKKKHF